MEGDSARERIRSLKTRLSHSIDSPELCELIAKLVVERNLQVASLPSLEQAAKMSTTRAKQRLLDLPESPWFCNPNEKFQSLSGMQARVALIKVIIDAAKEINDVISEKSASKEDSIGDQQNL